MGCLWLTDAHVEYFCQLKGLLHVNFGNTNITANCHEHLKKLSFLRALHIGSTRIKGQYIQNISTAVTMLNKLNLKGLGITDNVSGRGTINSKQLQQIALNLQNLTHLDVNGCMNIDSTAFDNFHNLKFLNIWMANGISESKIQ